jgi:hemolysin activation/secretion protein
VQPFTFIDAAWLYTRGPLATYANPGRIVSLGGGLRAAFGDHLQLETTLAIPTELSPHVAGESKPRLLISLTVRP